MRVRPHSSPRRSCSVRARRRPPLPRALRTSPRPHHRRARPRVRPSRHRWRRRPWPRAKANASAPDSGVHDTLVAHTFRFAPATLAGPADKVWHIDFDQQDDKGSDGREVVKHSVAIAAGVSRRISEITFDASAVHEQGLSRREVHDRRRRAPAGSYTFWCTVHPEIPADAGGPDDRRSSRSSTALGGSAGCSSLSRQPGRSGSGNPRSARVGERGAGATDGPRATRIANRTAVSTASLSRSALRSRRAPIQAARNPAPNASPAPTVSTTRTAGTGTAGRRPRSRSGPVRRRR